MDRSSHPNMNTFDEKKDIFDQIMCLPGFRCFYGIYEKNRPVLLYIFFGGLTTFISIGSFVLCSSFLHINELIANIISWICAVSFAYAANRKWVFQSLSKGTAIIREAASFFAARLTTLGLEEAIILVFVTLLHFNGLLIKITAQFVVLVLNYVLSKFLIFKTRP